MATTDELSASKPKNIDAAPKPRMLDATIVGAQILDPKIVNGRIVGGQIVGGKIIEARNISRKGTMRALHLDSQHRHSEIIAVIGLGMALLMMYIL